MELKQFSKIMGTLTLAFPNANVTEKTVELYHKCLSDLDYEPCGVAIQQLIMTENFFPTVAKIREKYLQITSPEKFLSTTDVFNILNKARQDYGRYNVLEAIEYIKSQSNTLYEVVKAIGYTNLYNCDLNCYRKEIEGLFGEINKNAKEQAALSDEVKTKIAKISAKMKNSALAIELKEEF